MSMYDVYPNDLIEKVAEELKKIEVIKAPEWADFVKTGVHKERAPEKRDWWYVRAAAILRTVAVMGPIGVSKLRTKYGGRKNRGVRPDQFRKGSGNIIRKVLQQLEKAELIKFVEIGVHKGRVIAPKGNSLLDKVAVELIKQKPKTAIKKEAPKVEKKVEEKPEEVKTDDKKALVKKEPTEPVKVEKKETQPVKVEEKKEEAKEAPKTE